MLFEEMFLGAAPPSADEIVIDGCGCAGAEERNHAARPFLSYFRANLCGHGIDEARNETFGSLLLDVFAGKIDTSSSCRGEPEGGHLVGGGIFEPVNQAQLLQHAHGN